MLYNLKKIFMPATMLRIFFLFFMLQFISGCVSLRIHATGLEPAVHPVPDSSGNYKKLEETELMASSFKLLWFFPVTPEPDINQIIENKIIGSGGDNIIDMKVWHERQIWILGTVDIIHIKGTIIRYTD